MTIAIILSGGVGSRFGSLTPKQYMVFDGKPMVLHTLEKFQNSSKIGRIVIVASDDWHDPLEGWIKDGKISKFIFFANPGRTRQTSIKNALIKIKESGIDDELVIIHDAVRPFVSQNLIERCIDACVGEADGIMPVIPVTDTTYVCADDSVTGLLDRSKLFSGQSPEVYKLDDYYRANIDASEDVIQKVKGSSEIAFLMGMNIKTLEGEVSNVKITTKEDMNRYCGSS